MNEQLLNAIDDLYRKVHNLPSLGYKCHLLGDADKNKFLLRFRDKKVKIKGRPNESDYPCNFYGRQQAWKPIKELINESGIDQIANKDGKVNFANYDNVLHSRYTVYDKSKLGKDKRMLEIRVRPLSTFFSGWFGFGHRITAKKLYNKVSKPIKEVAENFYDNSVKEETIDIRTSPNKENNFYTDLEDSLFLVD